MDSSALAERNAVVQRINWLLKNRRVASYIALGLLIVSYAAPHNVPLLWVRSVAWGVAGGLCLVEAFYRKKINLPIGGTLLYAALYVGFTALLLFRAVHQQR